MARLTRAARGAAIALVLAVVVAAPVAAETPTRTVTHPTGWFAPAGEACTFDVRGTVLSGFEAMTVFDASHWIRSVRIKGYYENLANHKTYAVNDTWTELDVYDATTNVLTITGNGQIDVPFWPGDASPFGGLNTIATLYRFQGTTTNVLDYNANRTAAFSWSGRITDICAALS